MFERAREENKSNVDMNGKVGVSTETFPPHHHSYPSLHVVPNLRIQTSKLYAIKHPLDLSHGKIPIPAISWQCLKDSAELLFLQ